MRKPVAHVSRTLLQAEKNYSQIEKEGFAILFTIKKIHRFVHGRKFVLQMDHRPLLSIFGSKNVSLHMQLTGCNVGEPFY